MAEKANCSEIICALRLELIELEKEFNRRIALIKRRIAAALGEERPAPKVGYIQINGKRQTYRPGKIV